MSKYDPLGVFLREQKISHIPMTFANLEKILGTKLPNSKQYPAWWSNSTTNNVMTKQWLDAGFHTESINVEQEKLVFRKLNATDPGPAAPQTSKAGAADKPFHPMFGCMKGLVTIPDDVDLTDPADPEWGESTYGLPE